MEEIQLTDEQDEALERAWTKLSFDKPKRPATEDVAEEGYWLQESEDPAVPPTFYPWRELEEAEGQWVPYTGPRGGKGYKHTGSGKVHYGDKPPSRGRHREGGETPKQRARREPVEARAAHRKASAELKSATRAHEKAVRAHQRAQRQHGQATRAHAGSEAAMTRAKAKLDAARTPAQKRNAAGVHQRASERHAYHAKRLEAAKLGLDYHGREVDRLREKAHEAARGHAETAKRLAEVVPVPRPKKAESSPAAAAPETAPPTQSLAPATQEPPSAPVAPQAQSQAPPPPTALEVARKVNELAGPHNLVGMKDVRAAFPGVAKEELDAAINDARRDGLLTGSGAEGREGITDADHAAKIVDRDGAEVHHLAAREGQRAALSQPPPAPIDGPAIPMDNDAALAGALQDAAMRTEPALGSGPGAHRVFIADVFDRIRHRLPPGTTLEQFKARLNGLRQSGHVVLSRLDLVEAVPPHRQDALRRSKTTHIHGEAHMITVTTR